MLKEEPDKQIQLDRMKRRATALLAASAAIFSVALAFESADPRGLCPGDFPLIRPMPSWLVE